VEGKVRCHKSPENFYRTGGRPRAKSGSVVPTLRLRSGQASSKTATSGAAPKLASRDSRAGVALETGGQFFTVLEADEWDRELKNKIL